MNEWYCRKCKILFEGLRYCPACRQAWLQQVKKQHDRLMEEEEKRRQQKIIDREWKITGV